MHEAGVNPHFGQMLVHEPECVGPRAGQFSRQRRLAVIGDHLFPAAAIAGERKDRERKIRRHQAALDERPHREGEGSRVATGISNAFARANRRAIRGREFRHAVDPGRIDAVCRRGINHAGAGVGHERGRFLRGDVGQAKERDVGRIELRGARGRVFAVRGVDDEQLNVRTHCEPLVDLEPRGALVTVDKNLGSHSTAQHRLRPGSRQDPR